MEKDECVHIVMFPWLAIGHIIPFLNLAKLLAHKGYTISFISTPKNLSKLPKLPFILSSKITFISLPLPRVPNLPASAESSTDVSYNHQQLLKAAYDLLKSPVVDYLTRTTPDWVVYDYASPWLPPIAAQLNISTAFFCLFNAAVMCLIGPPSLIIDAGSGGGRPTVEDLTSVPEWIPFESNITFRLHEVSKYIEKSEEDQEGLSDTLRFALTTKESDVMIIRSSPELEPEWFELLVELLNKPVIPLGFMPPVVAEEENHEDWIGIKQWLDNQRVNSVVYVAFGTEVVLSQDELTELTLGLEKSELPFFLVLRNSSGSNSSELEKLPHGFEERVKGRGIVHVGWVPQTRILHHESIGGFVTHCGWNSVIEGLGFGRVLIMFPALNEQGLNARLLEGKKLGVEIPREEIDGSFTADSVAQTIRLAMVDDDGELMRLKVNGMKDVFGDQNINNQYVDKLVNYLEDKRIS